MCLSCLWLPLIFSEGGLLFFFSVSCFPATQNMDKPIHTEMFPVSTYMLLIIRRYIYSQSSNEVLELHCIIHRRKFPTSHRYMFTLAFLCYVVSFCISQIKTCVVIPVCHISTFAFISSVRKFQIFLYIPTTMTQLGRWIKTVNNP